MKRSLILAFMLILSVFFAERPNAQAQTVRAHGAGAVSGMSCVTSSASCSTFGQGVSFHFAFQGTGTGMAVLVMGTFSAIDRETGVRLDFSGTGTLLPQDHTINASGTCDVTTPDGVTSPGTCSLVAFDGTTSGGDDIISIGGSAANGSLTTLGARPANGNINID